MPVSRKKKRTTSTPEPSTSEPSSPVLPDQQVFHQYLRRLAHSAVRVVIETVMGEELDQFIGAAWESAARSVKGTATATTRATWSPQRDGSKRSKCPEIVRVNSTLRPLNVTVAMNRTLPKGSPRCSWLARAPIRWGSCPNPDGSGSQREYDQSSQPDAHPAI